MTAPTNRLRAFFAKASGSNYLYLLKLAALFCLFYGGCLAIIGLSTPEGYYAPFVARYLDVISVLRNIILYGAAGILHLFGYTTEVTGAYTVTINNYGTVHLIYSCLGYGIISFWMAYVLVNEGSLKFKTAWLLGGIAVIIFFNTLRVCALLLAVHYQWKPLLNMDHHFLYNTFVYAITLLMMWLYLKQLAKK